MDVVERGGLLSQVPAAVVDGVLDLAKHCTLEDDLAFLVALRRLDGVLVLPAKTCAAVLARDVVDEVPPGDHHPAVQLADVDVDDTVEEPRRARGADEARRVALLEARQRRHAFSAEEQLRAADAVEKQPAHLRHRRRLQEDCRFLKTNN